MLAWSVSSGTSLAYLHYVQPPQRMQGRTGLRVRAIVVPGIYDIAAGCHAVVYLLAGRQRDTVLSEAILEVGAVVASDYNVNLGGNSGGETVNISGNVDPTTGDVAETANGVGYSYTLTGDDGVILAGQSVTFRRVDLDVPIADIDLMPGAPDDGNGMEAWGVCVTCQHTTASNAPNTYSALQVSQISVLWWAPDEPCDPCAR